MPLLPNMKRVEVVPEESFEPGVAAQMTIPILNINADQYVGYLREEDLEDFQKEPGVKRILLTASILEQKQDRLIVEAQWANRHMRRMEAQIVRLRIAHEEQKRINDEANKVDLRKVVWEILKIAGAAVVGGLITGKFVIK